MAAWIESDKQLPPDGLPVLVCFADGEMDVGVVGSITGRSVAGRKYWASPEECGPTFGEHPTHWMHLPDRPMVSK